MSVAMFYGLDLLKAAIAPVIEIRDVVCRTRCVFTHRGPDRLCVIAAAKRGEPTGLKTGYVTRASGRRTRSCSLLQLYDKRTTAMTTTTMDRKIVCNTISRRA